MDIWVDPEVFIGAIYDAYFPLPIPDNFGYKISVFNSAVLVEGPELIEVKGYFADAQTAAHFPLRCEGNLASPPGEGGEPIKFYWSAKVAGGIDLDIDNDNTNKTFGGPNRDLEEDRWESADKDSDGNPLPGKYIPVNDGDSDEDGIPGFADFNETKRPKGRQENKFVKATLDVSNTKEMIKDWKKAKIKFTYSCSPPSENLDPASIPEGMIRIWTKDATDATNVERKPVSVTNRQEKDDKGYWVPGSTSGIEFSADKLFWDDNGNRLTKIDLFIEGIGKGSTSGLIKVELSPRGEDNLWMPDEVRVTTVKVDADVDSDNDGNITEADDYVEEVSPGKIIPVNDGNIDGDKYIDCDDFDGIEGASFAQLNLGIPAPLDLEKISLKISCSSKKRIRIWTKNANEARDLSKDVIDVDSKVYSGKTLETLMGGKDKRTNTFWIEGLKPEVTNLEFAVAPDGSKDPAGYVYSEIVKICAIKVEPVGLGGNANLSNFIIGKIYVPTKWGGTLTLLGGNIKLFYTNGSDLSSDNAIKIFKDELNSQIIAEGTPCTYEVPENKHGWYYIKMETQTVQTLTASFIEEKCIDRMKDSNPDNDVWNSWWWPSDDSEDPNMFDNSVTYSTPPGKEAGPLKKYDDYVDKEYPSSNSAQLAFGVTLPLLTKHIFDFIQSPPQALISCELSFKPSLRTHKSALRN